MEYITITPTTVVPVTQEVKYLTVTYLVSEDNLTIPITNNPTGIKSIIIDGGKKLIWKIPESGTQTFTTPGEHTIQFILEDDTTLGNERFSNISNVIDILFPENMEIISNSLDGTSIKSLVLSEGANVSNNLSLPELETLEVNCLITTSKFNGLGFPKLKTIKIGKTGSITGGSNFGGLSQLTEVYIDGEITSGGNFGGCPNIKKLVFGDNFRGANITGNFNGSYIDTVIIKNIQETFNLSILGSGAYPRKIEFHCKNITNSMSGGSYGTFLEEVILGNEVLNIVTTNNYYFLVGCNKLYNVQIGNSLKKLKYFINAASILPKLTIPSNIEELGEYTLYNLGWTNVFDLEFKGSITLKSLSITTCKIPVLSIPSGSIIEDNFYGCYFIKLILRNNPKNSISANSISTLEFKNINTVNIPLSSSVKQLCFDPSVNRINGNFLYYSGTSLSIPKTVKYIGESAFLSCGSILQAYIEAEEIGETAFYGAFATEATLNINSRIIGKSAFYNQRDSKMNVSFSENLLEIGEDAFKYLKFDNSKSLNIYNCKIIGKGAFYGAYNSNSSNAGLSINLNNVEEIGDEAFYCRSYGSSYGVFQLSYCNLENIKKIGKMAFYGAKIDTLIIGKNIEYISDEAFKNTEVKTINILGNIDIPNRCFYENTKLTKVILTPQISVIGEGAFISCSLLTTINTDNIEIIGKDAFKYCSNLATINTDNIKIIGEDAFSNTLLYNNTQEDPAGGVYIGKVLYTTKNASNLPVEFRVKEGTISITDNFGSYSNSNVTSIYIPSSVEYIGTSILKLAKLLNTIEISPDNKYLDSRNNCNAIIETATNTLKLGCADTVIPLDIEVIDAYAFYNRNPSTIIIPETLKTIKESAFGTSSAIEKSVYVSSLELWLTIDFENASACPLNNSSSPALYVDNELVTEVTIPEGIKEISNGVFLNYPLNSLTLCEGITKIGDESFKNCGLTELVLPNSLKYIGERAFFLNNISSIIIPENVETIGASAFGDSLITATINSNLLISKNYTSSYPLSPNIGAKNYILGDQITEIGSYAFAGGNFLSITLSNNTTIIRSKAFSSCSNLYSIIIPASVTDILPGAFDNSKNLTDITINSNTIASKGYSSYTNLRIIFSKGKSFTFGEGVTSLGNNIFYNGTEITDITLPSTLSKIGSYAFDGCSNLTSLIVQRTTPPTFGYGALNNTSANLIIYVPAESVDTYKAASNWSAYADKIQAIPTE